MEQVKAEKIRNALKQTKEKRKHQVSRVEAGSSSL